MSRSFQSVVIALVVAATCGILMFGLRQPLETASAEVLTAQGELKWYRGNIHTHSLWSDGDDYPEMISLWYKEHGYDFLCLTDHNILADHERWIDAIESRGGKTAYDKLKARFPENWVEERMQNQKLQVRLKTFDEFSQSLNEPGKFLMIRGEEITDAFKTLPVHLNATNIQELIPPMKGESVAETIQNNVNAVIAQRERTGEPILVHLNHPNYKAGVTAEDLMRIRGENFFEVYNGIPDTKNLGGGTLASTEQIWDIILTKRLAELGMDVLYGLATDDSHNYHDIPSTLANPGRGWLMVLADRLAPESLIAAMEAGRFYASTGVFLEKVASSAEGLEIEVKAEPDVTYTIEFLGTRKGYDPTSEPVKNDEGEPIRATQIYSEDIGTVFKTVAGPRAEYRFTGDEIYVRARIISSKPHPNPAQPGDFEMACATGDRPGGTPGRVAMVARIRDDEAGKKL